MRSVFFITITRGDGYIARSPPHSDRGLTRRNRRFSGSFLHFNVGAVDAVGVLRTSPPTSGFAGTDDK
jgi:hypothetical protein